MRAAMMPRLSEITFWKSVRCSERSSLSSTAMAVADRGSLSRSAISPKKSPGAEHGQDDLAPVVAEDRDLDPPLQDHEEEVAFLVLEEDHRVLGVAPARGDPGQAGDVVVAELREDRDGPQELPLVHSWPP